LVSTRPESLEPVVDLVATCSALVISLIPLIAGVFSLAFIPFSLNSRASSRPQTPSSLLLGAAC